MQFWITNISNKNISLRDLALSIPARRSMNLLDSKHFSYTVEQLEVSAATGSLYKKRHLIKIRIEAPPEEVKPGIYISTAPAFMRLQYRATVMQEDPVYEELQMSDEQFADEMSQDKEEVPGKPKK